MSKFTILGLVSWLGSALILGFQGISTLMDPADKVTWKSLSLMDAVGKSYFTWIKGLSWVYVQKAATYVVTMPLFLLLFCIGIIFFILNTFAPKT
jgi:hypothetical protein